MPAVSLKQKEVIVIDLSVGGMLHISSGRKDYCSILEPEQGAYTPGAMVPCSVIKVQYKLNNALLSKTFYMHPSGSPSVLKKMLKMETDPEFFNVMDFKELIAIPLATRNMLSRDALTRIMDAICARAPK